MRLLELLPSKPASMRCANSAALKGTCCKASSLGGEHQEMLLGWMSAVPLRSEHMCEGACAKQASIAKLQQLTVRQACCYKALVATT